MKDDNAIKQALDRLYRYNKLKQLNAPEEIIEQGRRLVELSKSRLSKEQWAEVEERIADYSVFSEARDKRDLAWRNKCLTCDSWTGEEYALDSDPEDRWCGEYRLLEITIPKQCPKFRPKN